MFLSGSSPPPRGPFFSPFFGLTCLYLEGAPVLLSGWVNPDYSWFPVASLMVGGFFFFPCRKRSFFLFLFLFSHFERFPAPSLFLRRVCFPRLIGETLSFFDDGFPSSGNGALVVCLVSVWCSFLYRMAFFF